MMEELTEGYCLDFFEKLPWPDQLIISLAACNDRGVKYEPSPIYPDDAMEFLNARIIEYAGNNNYARIAEYVY
jgi:hypothetical protein